jgi:phosphoenolpyruvate carboxylase
MALCPPRTAPAIETDFDPALHERVADLRNLVDRVLRAHARPRTFETVERLRALTEARRVPELARDDELETLLDALSPEDAIDVIRAFALSFRLINLAEQLDRERRRRERARRGDRPLPGSLETLEPEDAAALAGVEITLAFTAHPTEVLRRTTSEKLVRIAALLRELDDRLLTREERTAIERELEAHVVLLWQSNELYRTPPTVRDEVRNLIARFRESLFDEVPALFERLEDRLGAPIPTFLSFGSWIGSDRDGNPNVAPDALLDAHEQARRFVLERYRSDVEALQARLSQDASRGAVSEQLLASVDRDAIRFRDVRYTIGPRQEAEPYRRKLAFVHRRLTLTLSDADGGYTGPDELASDLRFIGRSVERHSGDAVARPLRRLERAVAVFGFDLCALEWRQHRDVVLAALDEIVAVVEPDLPPLSRREPCARVAWFARELRSPRPLIPAVTFSARTADVLASLAAVRTLRARRGAKALGTFILAGVEDGFDLLALLALVRASGALDAGPAQIVPLLESASALGNAARIVDEALAVPAFRAHVAGCGDVWEIMLGYSDTTKLAGVVGAAWSIHSAQLALHRVAPRHGIRFRFFHGRGGSAGRGAADAREAIAAQPLEACDGRFKVTEQGEVITERYGLPSLARRNLELAVTSVVGALRRPSPPCDPASYALLERLAAQAQAAYVALVDDPAFLRFLGGCTPLDEIGELQISSRPGRRGRMGSLADLRAIPWAFGWTQCRGMLPGWYGIGSALHATRAERATQRRIAQELPFFATLLRGIERALAMTDLSIFERYARALVDDETLRERFVARIREEYERSVATILDVLGRERLLEDDPALAAAIALRDPYVDPLSLLQIRLLRAYRERRDPALRDAIRLSITGVAAGLRVTG